MQQSRAEKEREAEKAAHAKRVDDKRKACWATLIQELRDANKTQKIKYGSCSLATTYTRNVSIDGVMVEVRLDQQSTEHYSFFHKPVMRPFFFLIGAWSRNRTRRRAVEKKTGDFDWARVCQLVEAERLRVLRETEYETESAALQDAAEKQLKAMFKRRPELRAVEDQIEIDHGKFTVTMRRVELRYAEVALGVAFNQQEKNEQEESDGND